MIRTTFPHRKTIWALSLTLLTIAAITISFASWRVLTASAANTIIYVVPGGVGDGSSWAQGKDLAAALAGATSGTDLWVKTGTYKPTPTSDRNATFTLKNGVALYGGFVGTETLLSQRNPNPATNGTVLSGDLNGDDGANFAGNGENSYHVVTGGMTNNTAILDGFTIRGGNANGMSFPQNSGGGMYNDSSSPTLINVSLSGNSAGVGGGMYNRGNSSPTLTNVTFSGNSANQGGGMYNIISNPTLTNVTFSGNSASSGGGMFNGNSSPTLTNVTFSGNSASIFGGGMNNISSSSPTLTTSPSAATPPPTAAE